MYSEDYLNLIKSLEKPDFSNAFFFIEECIGLEKKKKTSTFLRVSFSFFIMYTFIQIPTEKASNQNQWNMNQQGETKP